MQCQKYQKTPKSNLHDKKTLKSALKFAFSLHLNGTFPTSDTNFIGF